MGFSMGDPTIVTNMYAGGGFMSMDTDLTVAQVSVLGIFIIAPRIRCPLESRSR